MAEEQPRKVPRAFSCLVKGPLGCLAFLLGALVVLVLFLPPAVGRLTDRSLERWFGEQHAGSLELGDVWLGSLYGQQRIESVILRDPDGDEVLRGSLRAPALTRFQRDPPRYGPVELVLDRVRIVERGDGTTNLGRALRRRPGAGTGADFWGEVQFEGITLEFQVLIARLSVVSSLGRENLLENLSFRGKATLGRSERKVELAGGADPATLEPLRLSFEAEQRGSGRAWHSTWDLERAPAALAGLLFGTGPEPMGALGPRLDRVELERDGDEIELVLEDEGATLKLKGELAEGRRVLQAGPEQTAKLSCPGDSTLAGLILARLLPLAVAPAAGGTLQLRVEELRWPLGGSVEGLSGLAQLDLELEAYELDPSLRSLLANPDGYRLAGGELRRIARLREGTALFARQRLPLADGSIEIDGTLDLASGALDLVVRAERDGTLEELGRFVGRSGELAPAAMLPPDPPEAPESTPPEIR